MTGIFVIGLAGTIAAGKGVAKEMIEKKYSAASFSLSDAIRDEVRRRGLELNRDNLVMVGNELRRVYGPDILAKRISRKISTSADADGRKIEKKGAERRVIVIDSIRTPAEIEFLRKKYKKNCLTLFIDAPIRTRYRRAVSRSREGEHKLSFREFKRQDEDGLGKNQPAWGNNLAECRRISDFVVINSKSKEQLQDNILQIVGRYLG
ncbi:MAG: hypothetical protein QW112_03000 [Candidatus Micrarchaeia archaeon]